MSCRLFHDWSDWGDPERGQKLYKGERMGDLWWQRRDCRRCGLAALRTVSK